MEKMKMHSLNITVSQLNVLKKMFPSCIRESLNDKNQIVETIDFDSLKQELSEHVIDSDSERYQTTWPGKRESLLLANSPISKTLRPYPDESIDFFNSRNIFIEGDNLDSLKLLQESYLEKIKFIYVDPPYNTGFDFVYKDNYSQTTPEYLSSSNQTDDVGNRLVSNPLSNGRFHSTWLSMLYPRIKLARNLLSDEGIFFLHIGEEELANAEKILSEVFGEQNKISIIPRVSKTASDVGNFFAPSVDFLLCYAKDINKTNPFNDKVKEDLFTKIESEGERVGERYRDDVALYQSSLTLERSRNARYYIECPDGKKCIPPEGKRWRVIEETFLDMKSKNMIVFKKTKTSPLFDENGNKSDWNLYTKSYLSDREEKGARPRNYLDGFINRQGADLIKKYDIPFDFSKPVGLIKYLLEITGTKNDDLVMDFFAGSSTTAHAVLEMNQEDGASRRFIMVQAPEKCDPKSEASKKGYENIAQISKDRIRKVIANLSASESSDGQLFDNSNLSFKVFKVDSSNLSEVYYYPDSLSQDLLSEVEGNIKSDRNELDLLFQVLIDWGVDITLPLAKEHILSKTIFVLNENSLIACFDDKGGIDEEFVKELAKKQPLRVVFRDAGFKSDSVKINVEQIFKLVSPSTEVKCI